MEFNKGQDDDDLYNLIIDDEIIPDYFIKKSGEVYSKKRNANFKKLKYRLNHAGYPRVGIFINGEQKTYTIHRLVANTFLGIVPNEWHIDHIDGDRENYDLSNLEIVTCQENQARRAAKQVFTEVLVTSPNGEQHYFKSMADAARHLNYSETSPISAGLKRNDGEYTTETGHTITDYKQLCDIIEFLESIDKLDEANEYIQSKHKIIKIKKDNIEMMFSTEYDLAQHLGCRLVNIKNLLKNETVHRIKGWEIYR